MLNTSEVSLWIVSFVWTVTHLSWKCLCHAGSFCENNVIMKIHIFASLLFHWLFSLFYQRAASQRYLAINRASFFQSKTDVNLKNYCHNGQCKFFSDELKLHLKQFASHCCMSTQRLNIAFKSLLASVKCGVGTQNWDKEWNSITCHSTGPFVLVATRRSWLCTRALLTFPAHRVLLPALERRYN